MTDRMSLLDIKKALRAGKYAWPGGYPLYFVTSDGEALSFDTVRAEWRNVVQAHLWARHPGCRAQDNGWCIAAVDTNWEDPDLFDAHTNQRIESAYAEPEDTDNA